MVQTDYDLLVEMGFDAQRAKLAVNKTKGLQDAIEWLDKNQDKPIEELDGSASTEQALGAASASTSGSLDADGDRAETTGTAASLKCMDCGKLFSSPERAEFHATRTLHTNFEESTEVIKPLTEEEKKAKLAELREKLAAKRAAQATIDQQDAKKNEAIRRKKTQDTEKLKEDLRRREQLKETEKRKREKLEDAQAKERVRQQIKETQEARRLQAEREKALREGRAVQDTPSTASKPQQPKVTASHSESRLQLRLPSGPPLIKTFPVETTLFEVASAIESERGIAPSTFTVTFPRKVFQQGIDFGLTLKEAGMVPSCALIVG
ncbi:hypothetical protein K440DRAFT_680754 [Wilcoxina mikolae CBS 423.85]|nr:hypothetical protein K440DRAFT_680754 [Wilcoxina mikolae CBS 423.85]